MGFGTVVETLNGKVYKPNGVCYLQGWSETMCIQPAIVGMLGYKPDMMLSEISLSPAFPANWDSLNAENLRYGDQTFEMRFIRAGGNYIYDLHTAGKETIRINFSPVLPLGSDVRGVWINGQPVNYSLAEKGDGVQVLVPRHNFSGHLRIKIECKGGTSVVPVVIKPLPGQGNEGLKIISQDWKNNKLVVQIEGLSGKTVKFDLFSAYAIQGVEGGNFVSVSPELYRISTFLPQNNKKWNEARITVTFRQ